MSTIPTTIEGIGPSNLIPKLTNADVAGLHLKAEEGFVLSRVDGHTSLGEILLLVPFERDYTVSVLKRLWIDGAIEILGLERPQKKRTTVPPVTPVAAAPQPHPGIQLDAEQIRRIDQFYNALGTLDAFAQLELGNGADEKEVKRAYFRLSKEFHPDRFYGKELGEYREHLTKIFQAIKAAFESLTK